MLQDSFNKTRSHIEDITILLLINRLGLIMHPTEHNLLNIQNRLAGSFASLRNQIRMTWAPSWSPSALSLNWLGTSLLFSTHHRSIPKRVVHAMMLKMNTTGLNVFQL